MRGIKARSLRRQTLALVAVSICTLLAVMSLYLQWFSQLSRQRAVGYAQDNLAQVSAQLESTFENVRNITLNLSFNQQIQEYLTTTSQGKKFIDLYPMISQMLEFILISNNDIYDILIYNTQGSLALSRQRTLSLDAAKLFLPYENLGQREPEALTPVMLSSFVFFPFAQTIYSVSGHNLMQRIGTCYVLLDGSAIQRFVEGITITENAQFFIVDASHRVIASNQKTQVGSLLDAELYNQAADAQAEIVMADGQRYIVQFQQINGWTAFSLIPVASLMTDFQQALRLGQVIGFLAASFLLLVGTMIGRDITRSVKGLVDFFREVTREATPKRIPIGGPMEIQVIQNGLNDMLDWQEETTSHLFKAQADLYETQLLQRQTQFTALQRQINPHFLFNTLNCISNIGAVRGVPEVVQISTSMANIFRYCIKAEDLVSVHEEISCVQDYLNIIRLRYQGKILSTLAVDEALHDYRMPKMILQPLVENAVFHGLEPKLGGGSIHITVQLEQENTLVFTVADDGKGIDPETLAQLNAYMEAPELARQRMSSTGIGLLNILSRIRFVFGEKASLHIRSVENQGSCVCLRLPLPRDFAHDFRQKTEDLP